MAQMKYKFFFNHDFFIRGHHVPGLSDTTFIHCGHFYAQGNVSLSKLELMFGIQFLRFYYHARICAEWFWRDGAIHRFTASQNYFRHFSLHLLRSNQQPAHQEK